MGGTFTDHVAIERLPDGIKITAVKTDTTPIDSKFGVLNVLAKGRIEPTNVDWRILFAIGDWRYPATASSRTVQWFGRCHEGR